MRALAITATAVFVLLAALIVWFAVAPGSDPDGPVVTIAVSPPPPPPREPAAPAAAPLDLPPGFGITGPPGSPPTPGPPSPLQPPAQPQSAPSSAPTLQKDAATGSTDFDEANITLVAAPVPELIEESRYGPLPKVAADGRKPLDVYGRPFAFAAKAAGIPPRVALLVSGMARADPATAELVRKLPPRVSLAYGAYGQDLQTGVDEARKVGHEVLLEVPLEPADYPQNDPGPHTLLTSLPPAENMKRLQWLMSRFTGYVGITNAMGAKFVGHRDSLLPVLEEVRSRGLLFLEDGGAEGSVAREIAGALGLSYSVANIRIDALPGPDDISKALSRLEEMAKERGTAIGIASARPETIKQVAAWAGQLDGKGVVLIPVSAAVRSLQQS